MTSRPVAAEPSVRALSRDLLTELDQLAGRLADEIRAAEGLYRGDQVVPGDDLWQSCRHNLEHILTQLAGDAPPTADSARATGRRRAEQGLPLPAILHAYRIGGRFVWDALLARADTSIVARDALLRTAADVWTIIDDYSEALIEAYRQAVAEQASRDTQVRAAALSGLLDGSPRDESQLWQAAAALRLPQHGTFIVVAAETQAAGEEPLPRVAEVLRRHNLTSAWRVDTEHQIGLVATGAPPTITTLCQQLSTLAKARVGVSEPYTGLDQTSAALRQARVACAAGTPGSRELVRYEQRPVAVLLASVPDLSHNVARAILGPVLALAAPERDVLLETLRAWFAADGSATAAAAQLHVHRNTVHYRLRRVEALTGRNLSAPTAVGELHLALESTRILAATRSAPSRAR